MRSSPLPADVHLPRSATPHTAHIKHAASSKCTGVLGDCRAGRTQNVQKLVYITSLRPLALFDNGNRDPTYHFCSIAGTASLPQTSEAPFLTNWPALQLQVRRSHGCTAGDPNYLGLDNFMLCCSDIAVARDCQHVGSLLPCSVVICMLLYTSAAAQLRCHCYCTAYVKHCTIYHDSASMQPKNSRTGALSSLHICACASLCSALDQAF